MDEDDQFTSEFWLCRSRPAEGAKAYRIPISRARLLSGNGGKAQPLPTDLFGGNEYIYKYASLLPDLTNLPESELMIFSTVHSQMYFLMPY